MKQVINEGRVRAAITEDGDLVVFKTPCILSKSKIDTTHPTKITCQYFNLDKLKKESIIQLWYKDSTLVTLLSNLASLEMTTV